MSQYIGKAKILDRNGMLLDVGKADLTADAEEHGWGGTLTVFTGSNLASRSLTVLVEVGGGARALAQVGPKRDEAGDLVVLPVTGVDPAPF